MGGGTFGTKQDVDIVEDLINAKTGEIIPKKYSVQIPGIPKLKFDWSKIIERDGTQVATVGTHSLADEPGFEQRGARYTAAGRHLHGLPPEHDRQEALGKGQRKRHA